MRKLSYKSGGKLSCRGRCKNSLTKLLISKSFERRKALNTGGRGGGGGAPWVQGRGRNRFRVITSQAARLRRQCGGSCGGEGCVGGGITTKTVLTEVLQENFLKTKLVMHEFTRVVFLHEVTESGEDSAN